jgi:Protein of unknown function (DUF732)
VNAEMDLRVVHAILPSLPDHQNPGSVLGCGVGAIEDAVFIVAPDRTATLKEVDRAQVHRFPLQHGYLSCRVTVGGRAGARSSPAPKITTVQVTPEPSAEAVLARQLSESVYDQRFLDRMASLGYTVSNRSLAQSSGHEVCRLLRLGDSPSQVNHEMAARMGSTRAAQFVVTSNPHGVCGPASSSGGESGSASERGRRARFRRIVALSASYRRRIMFDGSDARVIRAYRGHHTNAGATS